MDVCKDSPITICTLAGLLVWRGVDTGIGAGPCSIKLLMDGRNDGDIVFEGETTICAFELELKSG